MLLQPTWLQPLKTAIRTTFSEQFGRQINISDKELIAFLRKANFTSLDDATLHFKRAIAYYNSNFRFYPTFAHLISDSLPKVVEADGWEKQLYAQWPEFQPTFFSPAKNHLSNEVRLGGLFTDKDVLKLTSDFVRDIVDARHVVYTRQSVVVIEKTMFSLAYMGDTDRKKRVAVIEALTRMRRARVKSRDTATAWSGVHWSKALVRKQQIAFMGRGYSFWEFPKLALNDDVCMLHFGHRLTPARRNTIIEIMSMYASQRAPYLQYLLTVRPEFVLGKDEKARWRQIAPNFFPAYPY